MRIWDIPVRQLCRQHLLGEHRELHAIWTYLTTMKGGSYRKHPETLRWRGKKNALWKRHQELVMEMKHRGYTHASPLPKPRGAYVPQNIFIHSIREQKNILRRKGCLCRV